MEFRLDLLETKVEFYEAFSLKELEAKITEQIDNNKALMLEPAAIQHQAVFHPLLKRCCILHMCIISCVRIVNYLYD